MRFIFSALLLIGVSTISMAQGNFVRAKHNLEFQKKTSSKRVTTKDVRDPGDVIWSEDFDGAEWSSTSNNGTAVPANAPAGWEIGDLSGNGFYFRWSDVGPRGMFTSASFDCNEPSSAMNSTTGNNGYLMLEADFYNSSSDCSEVFEDPMDSYVEYNAGIDFTGYNSVHLVFEQMSRFCCGYNSTNDAWFMVSTDNGATWTKYSVSESDFNVSIGTSTAYTTQLDISLIAANESNVWFRFYLNGLSHYHWEIDDISFISPTDNDMIMNDYWNDYVTYRDGSNGLPLASSSDFTEGYYEYPWFIIQYFKGFHAGYTNYGYYDQTNVKHHIDISRDGMLLESFVSESIANVIPGIYDTTQVAAEWLPTSMGNYKIKHYLSSDQVDAVPENDTVYRTFKVGDSLVSPVDFSKVNDEISPSDWDFYDEDGDGLGFFVNIPEPALHGNGINSYYNLRGVKIFIDDNIGDELQMFQNETAKVVASFYQYDSVNETFTERISSAEYTLTLADTGSIAYIPFALDGTSEYIFVGGKFLVSVNMYGTYNDNFDRLKTWKIKSCDNTTFKNSGESFVTVNASISTIDDVNLVTTAPAMALDIGYSNDIPTAISFNVKDEEGYNVYNALVNVEGYGSQSTSFNGTAAFFNIPDGSTINYSVSKEGYHTTYDTIQEATLDATYYATLVGKSYSVTFNINDGANPLEGASVSLANFSTQYTDSQGLTSFSPLYGNNDYYYSVIYNDFPEVSGYVSDLLYDTTINVSIDTTTYSATFIVTDGVDPISNASVYLQNEGAKYTNSDGEVAFYSIIPDSNSRAYSIAADGYYSADGSVIIDNSDIIEQVALIADTIRYEVTFEVNDGSFPIQGAEILIYDDTTITTNSQGIAVLHDAIPGYDINYLASALGYHYHSGVITNVNGDVTENITLYVNPATYSVTFHISDEYNPIGNVSVALENHGILETNSQGEVVFDNISPELDMFYVITADNYSTVRDYVSVINEDVDVYIDYSTVGIEAQRIDVILYPNPTNGQFIIDIKGQYHLNVINVTGKVVYEFDGEDKTMVNLTGESSGIYYVNIIQNSQIVTKQVIVQ